jgi:hypothetical protein
MKLSSPFLSVKGNLELRTPGVYRITCECSGVYMGQQAVLDFRLKEHQKHMQLQHLEKSAVAEHNISQGHCIHFHNTPILTTKTKYMDQINKEAIEIELHPYSMNREGGVCLKKSWKPLFCSFKTFRT